MDKLKTNEVLRVLGNCCFVLAWTLAPHRKGRSQTECVQGHVAEQNVLAQEEGSNSAQCHFMTYCHYHVLLG